MYENVESGNLVVNYKHQEIKSPSMFIGLIYRFTDGNPDLMRKLLNSYYKNEGHIRMSSNLDRFLRMFRNNTKVNSVEDLYPILDLYKSTGTFKRDLDYDKMILVHTLEILYKYKHMMHFAMISVVKIGSW